MNRHFITAESGNVYNTDIIRCITWADAYKSFMAYTESGNFVLTMADFNDIKSRFLEIVSTPHLIHYYINTDKIEYIVKEMTNFSAPKVYAIKIGEQRDGMFAAITVNDKEYQKVIDAIFPKDIEPAEDTEIGTELLNPLTVKVEQSSEQTPEPEQTVIEPTEPKETKRSLLKRPKITKL